MDLVFKALAEPVRRTILDELAERNGQTLYEICVRLAMRHNLALSRQAVTKHLRVLEHAGLLSTKRDGKYKFHYLNPAPISEIHKHWIAKYDLDINNKERIKHDHQRM